MHASPRQFGDLPIFVLALFVLLASQNASAAEPPLKTRNVIYVTLDGLRWQEVFGGAQEAFVSKTCGVRDVEDIRNRYLRDSAQERRALLMPFFWKVLATQGQIFGDPEQNAPARITNTLRFSYPGYSEMFVGFADDDAIRSNAKTPNPHVNVLEYLHRQPQFAQRVSAFATWDVFPYILNQQRSGLHVHAGTGPILDEPLTQRQEYLNELIGDTVVVWNGNGLDALTLHAAREHLRRHKPRVLYIGLGETDEWAHGRRYDLYLDAAQKADAFLARLWSELQLMPQYRDQTALVISTDHGRGSTVIDWTDHGANIAGAEFIWIGALGPDTPPLGIRRDVATTQSQLAATLAHLLGQDFPAAQPQAAAALPGIRN